MKVIFWRASLITCDAMHVTDLILRIAPKSKPKIINFGIDTNFFNLKEKIFSKENKIKIISTRNHESIYSLGTLLEASKYLKDNGINFSLTIAGYGSETENLVRKTKELGLSDFIKFTGRYNYQTLPHLLSKYDFFISTSLSDAGLASSIAEAMACRNIVIVSDSADNKLWITNCVNGFLFRTGSSKSLYKAIISAIDSKKIWDQISINARKTILERNDITNEMRKMYKLMELI
jgi:glycosyltransferase involved in cell wall biosynthesis